MKNSLLQERQYHSEKNDPGADREHGIHSPADCFRERNSVATGDEAAAGFAGPECSQKQACLHLEDKERQDLSHGQKPGQYAKQEGGTAEAAKAQHSVTIVFG